MNTPKTPLGGRPISHKEAFKGLGRPTTWERETAATYEEFRAKPEITLAKGKPIFNSLVNKAKRLGRMLTSPPELRPTYASSGAIHEKRKAKKAHVHKRKQPLGTSKPASFGRRVKKSKTIKQGRPVLRKPKTKP